MGERQAFDGLEEAVRTASRRFVDAIRCGDPVAAVVAYADNARLVAPSAALIEGRAEIESFWRAGLEAGMRAIELEPVRMDRHGSFAIEIGQYSMQLRQPDGGDVMDRGSYLLVHGPAPGGGWAWLLEAFIPEGDPQVAARVLPAAGGEVGGGS
jgi:ketosteroid isomerase-like protein